MYKVIPLKERKEYSYEQLQEIFDGKWLYLVNTLFTKSNRMIKGTPVVVADSELEGIKDGIYEQFKRNKGYGLLADADFTDSSGMFPSLFWSEDV